MMNSNFVTHVTYLLEFTAYKYNELQVSIASQKMNCKVSYKTPFFHIVFQKAKHDQTTSGNIAWVSHSATWKG